MTAVLQNIRAELDLRCDGLGQILSGFAQRPLSDYLRYISKNDQSTSETAKYYRKYVIAAARKLNAAGKYFQNIDVDVALNSLWNHPIIFTAPHSQLLPERFTLAGYSAGLATSYANSNRVCWMLACATVRLQVARREGPGWLPYRGQVLKVFGLPTRQLKWRRVCSPGQKLTFAHGELCLQNDQFQSLIGDISGDVATDLFQEANRRLVGYCIRRDGPKIIDLDERFTAWVIAEHLESGQTPIHALILSDKISSRYKQILAKLQVSYDSRSLRFPTEHLWAIDSAGHLVALRRSNGYFVSASDGKPIVPCHTTELVAGLRSGMLLPSIFLSYFAMGYLPSLNLAGGVRQAFYMTAYLKIWRHLHAAYNTVEAQQHALPKLNLWAENALDVSEDLAGSFFDHTDLSLDEWINNAQKLPLSETSRNFCTIIEHDYFRISST